MNRPLLEHRLIFVTGKGGVGRSTVSGALGLAAAQRGMRTIVAELTGERCVAHAFGIKDAKPFTELELAPRLFTISISPERAMDEYLRVKVPGPLGHLLAQSHLFHHFAMATPGMRELLCLGKAWELAQTHRRSRGGEPYDLVIVDAPATGHGVGALKTPRMFSEIARVGPIAHQGQTIARTIADADFTAIVAVCTPEEMPVTETLELHGALAQERLELDAVVLNARYPNRFADAEMPILQRAASSPLDKPLQSAIQSALSEHQRAAIQAGQEQRLRAEFEGPVLTLPFVFAPAIGPEQLRLLATWLQEGL